MLKLCKCVSERSSCSLDLSQHHRLGSFTSSFHRNFTVLFNLKDDKTCVKMSNFMRNCVIEMEITNNNLSLLSMLLSSRSDFVVSKLSSLLVVRLQTSDTLDDGREARLKLNCGYSYQRSLITIEIRRTMALPR